MGRGCKHCSNCCHLRSLNICDARFPAESPDRCSKYQPLPRLSRALTAADIKRVTARRYLPAPNVAKEADDRTHVG